MYRTAESLYRTPDTNITMYANYTGILKKNLNKLSAQKVFNKGKTCLFPACLTENQDWPLLVLVHPLPTSSTVSAGTRYTVFIKWMGSGSVSPGFSI